MVKVKNAPTTSKIQGSETVTLDLTDIVANTAQSRGMGVLSRLQDMGYGLFEKASVDSDKDSIWSLLFSDKPEETAHACALLEENEQELVALATSQRGMQLQPIGVYALEGNDGYDVIFGMRRTVAAAYNAAKHGDDATIEAKIFEFDTPPTPVQLKLVALKENDDRAGESPIDRAMTYKWLQKQGLDPKEIGRRINKSDQYVRNYIKLLDPLLEDKRMEIHTGKLKVEPALARLARLKEGAPDKGASSAREGKGDKSANRFRLPGVKGLTKILDAKKRPKSVREELWEYYKMDTVRQFLCEALGLRFEPYVEPEPEAEAEDDTHASNGNGKAAKGKKGPGKKGKTLKVKKDRAVKLLIAIGKTNARTWGAEKLKDALENIQNHMEDGQECEDSTVQGLLEKLIAGYSKGLSVEIV